ncbi:hypothetical protein Salat_2762000 [Sesamum alatum]|uniref:Uncharacterized protein n=1 Tax=Sesamum alatum TaxID=300844 RepID=A0AAE2C900_9LAMI|nr:hypothetical protein Salat_2762000 [Sesamum alatum]
MCRRAKEVFPELLNRLSRYEDAITRAEERVAKMEELVRIRDRRFHMALIGWACSVDVNRKHHSKIDYTWAKSCVATLKERYDIFMWVVAQPNVVWNQNLRFLVAKDRTWKALCQERKKAKWYINAYEDMYEELCEIFENNAHAPIEAVQPAAIDLNVPPPEDVVLEGSIENCTDNSSVNEIVSFPTARTLPLHYGVTSRICWGLAVMRTLFCPPGRSYLRIEEKHSDASFSSELSVYGGQQFLRFEPYTQEEWNLRPTR